MEKFGNITLINGDCMDYMATLPDKAYDLAIVDPPYGIGLMKTNAGNWGIRKECKGDISNQTKWDFERPSVKYFDELFRVSRNQIIFGGNYFIDLIRKPTSCFIVWDKMNGDSYFSDCELAWTSFTTATRKFSKFTVQKDRIHICQKPVSLYVWILDKYGNEGDKIIDTHLGSGSICIACSNLKFEMTGIEIDKAYYESAKKRLINHKQQKMLF